MDPYRPRAADLEDWLAERAAVLMDAEGLSERAATREAARRLQDRVGAVEARDKKEWMEAMRARLAKEEG